MRGSEGGAVTDGDLVSVPRHVLQCVLDTAAGSMDAGSGFLDDEEVEALRAAAVVLGVDPNAVTPAAHICKYRGHRPTDSTKWMFKQADTYCPDCRQLNVK